LSSSAANVPFQFGAALPIQTGIPSVTAVDPELRNPYVHRINAAVERALGAETSVTAAYVGSLGRSLFGQAQPNGGGGVPQAHRPDSRFSTQTVVQNTSSSDYHAFQLVARQRFARGLSLTAAYTLADSKDDSSADVFAALPVLVNQTAEDRDGFQGGDWAARPRSADWGRSDFLVRHNFTFSHVWELPRLAGRRGMIGALLGGWGLSGIAVLRSGEPVDLRLGRDANDDGDTRDRPGLIAGALDDLYARGPRDRTQYLVTRDAATGFLGVASPPSDPFAAVRRNAVNRPAALTYDLSLLKSVALKESLNLSVEANAFNIFNRPVFGAPVATLSNARFGQITGTAFGSTPRQLQFGIKLRF